MPSNRLLNVVYEDEALLIVAKPAGLVCHPSKNGPLSSLIGRARAYAAGAWDPRLAHRLDRETSGVVALAKTSAVAAALMELFSAGMAAKEYWAIVHGWPDLDSGVVNAPLGRDLESRVAIKDCVRFDGSTAVTRWRVGARWSHENRRLAWLRLWPETGRKHQLRLHCQWMGHPIVGDKIYGNDPETYLAFVERRLTAAQRAQLMAPNQALHAARLWLPWEGEEREFAAQPGPDFGRLAEGRPPQWEPFLPEAIDRNLSAAD